MKDVGFLLVFVICIWTSFGIIAGFDKIMRKGGEP